MCCRICIKWCYFLLMLFFRLSYRIFLAESQKFLYVAKFNKFDEEGVFSKKNHLFKTLLYKNGKVENFADGCQPFGY